MSGFAHEDAHLQPFVLHREKLSAQPLGNLPVRRGPQQLRVRQALVGAVNLLGSAALVVAIGWSGPGARGDTPRLIPDYLPSASSAILMDTMGTAVDARNEVSEWPLKLDALF